jgi:hypothetical protein
MQPLLAQMPHPVFLTHLVDLECTHPIVYFPEKERQNQRHEVCLKYKGLEYWSVGAVE